MGNFKINYQIVEKYKLINYYRDVNKIDDSDFTYSSFFADIVMENNKDSINLVSFYTPILDFLSNLMILSNEMSVSNDYANFYEFTESNGRLLFEKNNNKLFITTNYSEETIDVNYKEFNYELKRVCNFVIEEILYENYFLRDNIEFAKYIELGNVS